MKTLKYLIVALFALVSVSGFSQGIDTIALGRNDVFKYLPSDTTYVFFYQTDTVDSDSEADTLRFYFSQHFTSLLSGSMYIQQDTITGESPLEGTATLYTRIEGFDWEAVEDAELTIDTDPAASDTAEFYLRKLQTMLEIITTTGVGFLKWHIVLKPN